MTHERQILKLLGSREAKYLQTMGVRNLFPPLLPNPTLRHCVDPYQNLPFFTIRLDSHPCICKDFLFPRALKVNSTVINKWIPFFREIHWFIKRRRAKRHTKVSNKFTVLLANIQCGGLMRNPKLALSIYFCIKEINCPFMYTLSTVKSYQDKQWRVK